MPQQPDPADCRWVDECYVVVEEVYRHELPNGALVDLCAEPSAVCPTEEQANAVADRLAAEAASQRGTAHRFRAIPAPVLTH